MLHWKSPWYWFVLIVAAGIVLVAIGPGLWLNEQAGLVTWYASWQKQLFSSVCHQQFDRMFQINATPMAVCSRCLGIYTSFLAGILFLPIIPQFAIRNRFIIPLLIFGILLNLLDVISYAMSNWDNTLYSRLAAGILIGLPAAVLLGTSEPKQFKLRSL